MSILRDLIAVFSRDFDDVSLWRHYDVIGPSFDRFRGLTLTDEIRILKEIFMTPNKTKLSQYP